MPARNALLLGEMGIANTSVASLLLARLCVSLARCTGGHRLDAAGIERKRAVLQQALDVNAAATRRLMRWRRSATISSRHHGGRSAARPG